MRIAGRLCQRPALLLRPCSARFTRQYAAARTPPSARREKPPQKHQEVKTPTLVEQLFPEESKRYDAQQKAAAREIPRLPLETLPPPQPRKAPAEVDEKPNTRYEEYVRASVGAGNSDATVLVLRNASKNLTEDDFRRLIPQGRHIEGWSLEQGDIIKVIPYRDLATLEQQNVYYLLFSNALSAFTYQGHATRIHNLVAQHTPSSLTSAIAPPTGYMVEGLDVHSAIESYALVPPTQDIELRQLKPPLKPMVQALVDHHGLPALVSRKDKMPFEARMTMEGPQLPPSKIRHIIMESGNARALSWSGGPGNVKVTRWTPKTVVSPSDDSYFARKNALGKRDDSESNAGNHSQSSNASTNSEQPRRTPGDVFIIGFHTEASARTFVQHWHRKPLAAADELNREDEEGDIPPIANVELLW